MDKVRVVVYHKNISKIYPQEWIDRFRESIDRQTYIKFDILEVNYGGRKEQIFDDSEFYSKEFDNFVGCLNFCLDQSKEYDAVFNTNVDDYYSFNRIERQLPFIKKGFDIVSSNFSLIDRDKEVFKHNFHNANIKSHLLRNHNIIGHPVVAYSKRFINEQRYNPDEIPIEDLNLWKRTIDKYNFVILHDNLLFHRIHENSVCQSENR